MSKHSKKYLAVGTILALVIALFSGGMAALAVTDTWDEPADVASGVAPPCVNFHGNGTNENVVVTLPFPPGSLIMHKNYTATTNNTFYTWLHGQGTNAAWVHTNGSAGPSHTTGTNVWTVSSNVITIPYPMHGNSSLYFGRACR